MTIEQTQTSSLHRELSKNFTDTFLAFIFLVGNNSRMFFPAATLLQYNVIMWVLILLHFQNVDYLIKLVFVIYFSDNWLLRLC